MTHSFPTRRSSDLQTDIFQGQSMSHAFAYAYATAADDVAIGWNQTGGSATGSIVANALFEEGAAGPDPLSVSVGADQAVYVGQTATVTATADGGSEAYTYAWTRVSGPTGSFLNAGQASTVFTPSGGEIGRAHV